MPYSHVDFAEANPSYGTLVTYEYNNNYTLEQHKASLMHVFDQQKFSMSWLEKTIRKDIPSFSVKQIDQSKEARAARAAISRNLRESMLDTSLAQKKYAASAHTDNPMPALGLARPWASFVRPSWEPEDMGFNRSLEMAFNSEDPAYKATILFEELEKCRIAAGINKPEDLYALLDLSDQELAARFPQITRYASIVAETPFLLSSKDFTFSPEQAQQLQLFSNNAQDLGRCYQARMSMVANPLYEDFGSDFFLNRDMGQLYIHCESLDLSGEAPYNMTKIKSFLSNANSYNNQRARGLMDHFIAGDDSLKTAVFGVPGSDPQGDTMLAFHAMEPVVAHTLNEGVKVLIPGQPGKVVRPTDHMTQLADIAAKADKWLLTGSKEFAAMQRELNALNAFCQQNPEASAQELAERTAPLAQAAQAYLDHKNIRAPYDVEKTNQQGKNAREQSRIDVARSILGFAQAQGHALDNAMSRDIPVEQMQDPNVSIADSVSHVEDGGIVEEVVEQIPAVPIWQQELQENAAQAKARLDAYVKGTLGPADKPFPNSNSAYLKYVTQDLSVLAFQEALAIEDSKLKGEGVFQTMLREQGYKKAFESFGSAVKSSRAFVSNGLISNKREPVGSFLEANGPRKMAEHMLIGNREIKKQDLQDEKNVNIEKKPEGISFPS